MNYNSINSVKENQFYPNQCYGFSYTNSSTLKGISFTLQQQNTEESNNNHRTHILQLNLNKIPTIKDEQ